ncbi:hypothetical protein HMI54_014582 [Coelomomyces lativittatus]|nr:hypothetical protein HMI56_001066 [Coelomomyces lativittatus]KAJ1509876.1 hypothetical protein HMI55_007225 [Coelomomyces lativittatus]KAJ1513969.1 hypothetical protein HMI54_014582 [Coelomomyces lativittatus]
MDIPQFIEKWLRQQTFSSFSNKASIQPNQNTAELTSHDIQLLLTHLECAEWLKLPKKAPVPTNPEEVQVIQRLKHTQEWIRKYHDNPVNQVTFYVECHCS